MGLFDSFFGKSEISNSDGLWLKGYRESDWVSVASFSIKGGGSQSIDASSDSCYVDGGDSCFCILRSIDANKSLVTYFGCFFADSMNDEIGIVVDRTEKLNGGSVAGDVWRKGSISLKEQNTPGISNAILKIRNMATFNSYSTLPPYVFVMNTTSAKK
jgi:hypothetical protein